MRKLLIEYRRNVHAMGKRVGKIIYIFGIQINGKDFGRVCVCRRNVQQHRLALILRSLLKWQKHL